jgi:hypothetical protein
MMLNAANPTSTVEPATRSWWTIRSKTSLATVAPISVSPDRHQDPQRVEIHDHPQHLDDVVVSIPDRVELGTPRALDVVDRHVPDRMPVGQERQRDGGDAREPRREQAEIRLGDGALEGAEVGDGGVGQPHGQPADGPLGRHPEQPQGAGLAGPGPHDLVVGVVQPGHQFGDAVVWVGHVGVGPDHHLPLGGLGADPAGGAGALVGGQQDGPDPRGGLQDLPGPIDRAVIHTDQLIAEPGSLQRGGDAFDLQLDVVTLVVTGQHDRDVGDVGLRRCLGQAHGVTHSYWDSRGCAVAAA